MHIALVIERFEPERGGAERWAFDWTRWLVAKGHEVSIVASEINGSYADAKVHPHVIGRAESRYAFAARVERYVESLSVDVIHDLGVGWRYDILQPHFGSRRVDARQNLRTLPLVKRVRTQFSRRHRARLRDIGQLEARQYAARGQIVAVSEMTKRHIVADHDVAPSRITVIRNGVDTGRFAPPDPEQRRRRRIEAGIDQTLLFLLVAHNFRLKGLETALTALTRLPEPACHLMVVGRGDIPSYKTLADRLGVSGRVTFQGHAADMAEYYGMADVLLHPTFYDPCSLVVLEAAACGLPVITSRMNGAAEIFVDGHSAHIVDDPGDAIEVAGRMRGLLDMRERLRLAAAGRAAALEATAERSFAKLLTLCEEMRR